ncbi:solute carrier family 52, riboflavin transporter, member 3-A-like [Nasonia vitripennis]|uniref:Riboflavin transporter n=1 Tax=Nasonia vitripennis TaxID=7425 RepID=A0A7M7QVL9_NASVI|nr:solute carrier family 52, riboflavin transporter, member 3-A-like [Nasonia vitripennis]
MQQHIGGMVNTEQIIDSQTNPTWYLKPSTVVHILVMMFGISAWIGINGIFIQLPLLVNSSPESWGLAAYLVVTIQVANITPIIYSLLRKSSFEINESHCILGMLGMATFVMGLLAFLYDKTSSIAGKEHSTALFILTFFTAAVSCTSSILFMPYLSNFKEIYLVSYFVGEGLSGVMPSIVALIQGIDESPKCNDTSNIADSLNTSARFSPQYYFLFLFMCLLLSSIAFFLLENLSYIKQEKSLSRSSDNNSVNNESKNCNCQRQVSVLSEGSISENDVMESHVCIDTYKKTDVGDISNVHYGQSNNQLTLRNVYLYSLLSIICLLANGLLPGLQPYACLSYGNMTYHLSATLSQIANPTACLLALWYLPHSRKVINCLSIVILIASSYVIYLALVSPDPPLQDSQFGKILVILSWILLIGFISYVKLIITSVFRRKSEKTLFHVGVAMQVGSACGAVLSFVLITFTNLLQEHKPCGG